MAGKKKPLPSFEAGLEALEKVVLDMEDGQMSLEDSVKAYEQGMLLYGELQKQLDGAKARVEKIKTPVKAETVETEPFEVPDE